MPPEVEGPDSIVEELVKVFARVTMRTQKKQQGFSGKKEKASGVRAHPIDAGSASDQESNVEVETETADMPRSRFNGDLFGASREQAKLSSS